MKKTLLVILFIICYHIYGIGQNITEVIVEGELEFVSPLPNPEKMDYPDCNFSTIFNVNTKDNVNRINVVFLGIKNRKSLSESNFRVGDKLRLTLILFEKANADIRQTQLVDNVEDFDIEVYFAVNAIKIGKYSEIETSKSIKFIKKKTNEINILPIDKKASKLRNKSIKKDIKRIEDLLKLHGGTWEQWEEDLKKFQQTYTASYNNKESKWVENSFFSAGTAYNDESGNFVEAMVEFRDYLKQYNIDLMVLRIPYKGEICADLFATLPSDKIANPYALKLTHELLKNDIEVIDILPILIEKRFNYPLTYFYQDFDELHPGEQVSWIAAEEIAKKFERYTVFRESEKKQLYLKDTIGFRNKKKYKYPVGNSLFSDKELLTYKTITNEKRKMLELNYDNNKSPFCFIGNSFLAYPSIRKGGSIPHYFSYLTSITPDVYYRSAGIGLGRLVYKRGLSFLENRKVFVYIVHPSLFHSCVPLMPLSVEFGDFIFFEHKILSIKNNWADTTVSPLIYSPNFSMTKGFTISKEGCLIIQGLKGYRTNSGDVFIRFSKQEPFKKGDFLKVYIKFEAVGYAKLNIQYGEEVQEALRTKNKNDASFEEFYFKIDKMQQQPSEIKINFKGVQKPQIISEIKISTLSLKEK